MIEKVISGGQTGADIAGLRAAVACGIETGGTAPKGYRTEDGSKPFLGKLYGLVEHTSRAYPPRTAQNIKDAHFTLVFGNIKEGGSRLTIVTCFKQKKPVFNISRGDFGYNETVAEVAFWISRLKNSEVVNIAGNRESVSPGIERLTKDFLVELFGLLNAS